jgi:hypothetical protein
VCFPIQAGERLLLVGAEGALRGPHPPVDRCEQTSAVVLCLLVLSIAAVDAQLLYAALSRLVCINSGEGQHLCVDESCGDSDRGSNPTRFFYRAPGPTLAAPFLFTYRGSSWYRDTESEQLPPIHRSRARVGGSIFGSPRAPRSRCCPGPRPSASLSSSSPRATSTATWSVGRCLGCHLVSWWARSGAVRGVLTEVYNPWAERGRVTDHVIATVTAGQLRVPLLGDGHAAAAALRPVRP